MSITERTIGDVTILELTGRLVLYEGEALLKARINDLVASGRTKILLDLRHVDYIDSAGVGAVIAKYLSVRRSGGDLRLLHLTHRTTKVLSITRLLGVFDAFTDEEEALRSFGAPSSEAAAHPHRS